MPFLAKHVQLRQVKTSHAEVLAQDAESEQQRRVSMKIELHHFTPVFKYLLSWTTTSTTTTTTTTTSLKGSCELAAASTRMC